MFGESPRWTFAVVPTRAEGVSPINVGKKAGIQEVSFVNGIFTSRGGRHVSHLLDQLVAGIQPILEKRLKRPVKPSLIRPNLSVFCSCLIENPTFDTQTKEFLTTPVKVGIPRTDHLVVREFPAGVGVAVSEGGEERFIGACGGVVARERRGVVAQGKWRENLASRTGEDWGVDSWDPQAGRRESRGDASVGRSHFNCHGRRLGESVGGGRTGRGGSRQLRSIPVEGGSCAQRQT